MTLSSNRHPALACCWSMIFSDLPSPAEAPGQMTNRARASRRRETGTHPGSCSKHRLRAGGFQRRARIGQIVQRALNEAIVVPLAPPSQLDDMPGEQVADRGG